MKTCTPIDLSDCIKGALMGAFIGDASGAQLEFTFSIEKNDTNVQKCLDMLICNKTIGYGQITDDSELTISLAKGLVEGKGKLHLKRIIENYGKWIASHPFDIGATLRGALFKCGPSASYKQIVEHTAKLPKNLTSESNGSLMRISPLGIWARNLSDLEIEKAVRLEVSISHPNINLQDAAVAYVIALAEAVKTLGNKESAYMRAKNWINAYPKSSVFEWFNDVDTGKGLDEKHKKAKGWARIAFYYTFYYLKESVGYSDVIKSLLKMGGDTDTNACIVGALIGACAGYSNLPEKSIKGVLEYNNSKGGSKRPEYLNVSKQFDTLWKGLLEFAPTKLEINE